MKYVSNLWLKEQEMDYKNIQFIIDSRSAGKYLVSIGNIQQKRDLESDCSNVQCPFSVGFQCNTISEQ